MKIVYIHQYFVTPQGTSGTRSYDVSRHLLDLGHEITMVTGVHDQSGLPTPPRWSLIRRCEVDGIKVAICNVRYSNRMGVLGRIWSFMKFAILATWVVVRERGTDLVFATSTPLTVGIPGRIGAALRRVPYVFEVRDLWPEDLLAAGRMKPGLVYKMWEWLEAFSYAKAKRILLVSKGFHDRLLERGLPPEKLQTVLLGADALYYVEAKPDEAFRSRHGLNGKTVAVYAGAHGDANGLPQVLDAAERLRERDDIAFVLLGDGRMKPSLKADAEARGLGNVHFADPVPKEKLPGVLMACDVGLMILKQITRPRWVTPNKIFDYMFSGLPAVVNFPGTTAELVDEEGVGVASEPGCADDLAAKVAYWADHPGEREAVGRRARELALAKYDRKSIARQLAEVFEACVAEYGKG